MQQKMNMFYFSDSVKLHVLHLLMCDNW